MKTRESMVTSSGSTDTGGKHDCTGARDCEITVVAAVIERAGLYLICQRPVHKRHGGLWEFPGGKLEPGESLLEAAIRELREELAVKVLSIGPVRFRKSDGDTAFSINFVDVAVESEPEPLEHSAIQWRSAEQLLQLPLAPIDTQFAESLCLSNSQNESFHP
ncbi:MAG: (deoxy)nucleoside triphosphate pyrophosphohydrolase [Candidatus Obscuribacterales bacterium]|nr:(deoxy)nucleoside triphosphate pyrophosphohydrolase [Candidatus Obscuribacterales bacterium]